MITVLPARFDTTSASALWPKQTLADFLDPTIRWSLGDFWRESSRGVLDLRYEVLDPIVMTDERAKTDGSNVAVRASLRDGAVAAATAQIAPDWSRTDVLLIWFAQPTDTFGGPLTALPLAGGATKQVPTTVIDIATMSSVCGHELGHGLGFDHERNLDGGEYGSPFSTMSLRVWPNEWERDPVPRLEDGPAVAEPAGDRFLGQPANRVMGPLLSVAQLRGALAGTPSTIALRSVDTLAPTRIRLSALDHAGAPGTQPVLVSLPGQVSGPAPGLGGVPAGDPTEYLLEFRRPTGYDAGIVPGGSVAAHSAGADGLLRYEGFVGSTAFEHHHDWACTTGGFAVRIAGYGPGLDYVDLVVLAGAVQRFFIRGVLLVGGFRTLAQLAGMSNDDMRNTLIVELANRTAQKDGQAHDDDTLAGWGALLVFFRLTGGRDDATLATMSGDAMRNTTIVSLGAQTGAPGPNLQALTDLQLAQVLFGSDLAVRGIRPGLRWSYIRGVLLLGRFRTHDELIAMSYEDQRNTLIVEMAKHSDRSDYRAMDDHELEGVGAVMVALLMLKIRTAAELATMSPDDQRNTLIVVIADFWGPTVTVNAQALSNIDLVLVLLGVDPAGIDH